MFTQSFGSIFQGRISVQPVHGRCTFESCSTLSFRKRLASAATTLAFASAGCPIQALAKAPGTGWALLEGTTLDAIMLQSPGAAIVSTNALTFGDGRMAYVVYVQSLNEIVRCVEVLDKSMKPTSHTCYRLGGGHQLKGKRRHSQIHERGAPALEGDADP